MRADDFIRLILEQAKEEKILFQLRDGLPLGLDVVNEVALSKKYDGIVAYRHTCVAGVKRSMFIRRLLITLSCLYDKDEACFFVISPRMEYGELLKLKNIDITAPYIHGKEDLNLAIESLLDLLRARENMRGCPKLFVVLDDLESLPECNKNGDLEEYRMLFERMTRYKDVELISGVDIMKSIFSGSPGAFVGIGNALVATQEDGKADVTYVNSDVSLSQPLPITFPSAPSITETIVFLNAYAKE